MQWHLCLETKHHNHCLHAVIDYFDKVGYNVITKHGIYQVYYDKYLSRIKDDILTDTGLYELKIDIPIPECMLEGSFTYVLNKINYNSAFCFLETKRMGSVRGYLK